MRISSSFEDGILEKIRLLYESSFPKEEKKPFPIMLKKLREGKMTFFAIFDDDDTFAGFMLTVDNGRLILLDYFAIMPDKRGGGIGSFALMELCKTYSNRDVVIEIEDERENTPDRADRIRRKSFYLKCGMKIMPFEISLYGVKMRVLTNGADVDFDSYHSIYREVFGESVAKNILLI